MNRKNKEKKLMYRKIYENIWIVEWIEKQL